MGATDRSGSEPRSANRRALSYIDRSRQFYAAHGYTTPYEWAVHDDAPFARPTTPVAEARVAVVTTAFPLDSSRPKQVLARSIDPVPHEMFTDDLSWHKEATHTDDVDSFLPLDALARAREQGAIAEIGPRFYCLPTVYSQRQSTVSGHQIAEWCREDSVDMVVLVPI